ncbi:MAG: RNA polymerase factor sigma-54, partial [Planctomycetota bacterium]
MRMSQGMTQTQSLSQKMAPRMIQSMEILQLPMMALVERVQQEMNENPMLEVSEEEPQAENREPETPVPDAPSERERELVVSDDSNNSEDFERLLNMDREMPGMFDDSFRRSSGAIQDESDRRHDLMANAESRPESLNDYLLHQLAEMDIPEAIERFAERIISTLDARDGGYLRMPLMDLLPLSHTPDDAADAEEALRVVQSLEPTGIAARDLRECLILQMDAVRDPTRFPHSEEMRTLINGHLIDLAENRLPIIQKKTGYSIELIQEVRDEMHKLNPKPGAAFMKTHVPNVTPDVILERDDEGKFVVLLDDDRVPTLRISEYYRQRLQDPQATAEEREYIKKKVNGASWLIEAIEQRRSTLTKVANEIVKHQERFLEEGREAIEPLKMQQIAERVGVHVTTVSRAVDDKWIQTHRGIMPL